MTDKELLSNEEIINKLMKEVDELRQECEELKKQLKTSEKWRINAESLNEKLDINNTRYRKALEEIEEYIYNNTDFDINDSIQSKTAGYDILQIIKDV